MVGGLGELTRPSLPLMDPLWAPLGAPKLHRFIAKMQLMRFGAKLWGHMLKTSNTLLKFPNDTFYFLTPFFIARVHLFTMWDPGDPHPSPQTTIFTPETSPFSLAAFQEGKDQ